MAKLLRNILPKKKKIGSVPVYLNVYDLTSINGYAYWLGLGVYHSGVQVHNVEYAFGAHDHATAGIFMVEPKKCPGFTFRKSILIGTTDMSEKDVQTLIDKLALEYLGNTYHLISKNCNHFCNDLSVRLTTRPIPRWVNRLARLGLLCRCVLPATLNETKVHHIKSENKVRRDSSTRKLRSQSSRFESLSTPSPSPTPNTLSTCSSAPSSRSRRQRRCVPPSSVITSLQKSESVW